VVLETPAVAIQSLDQLHLKVEAVEALVIQILARVVLVAGHIVAIVLTYQLEQELQIKGFLEDRLQVARLVVVAVVQVKWGITELVLVLAMVVMGFPHLLLEVLSLEQVVVVVCLQLRRVIMVGQAVLVVAELVVYLVVAAA
jgi:hypothetical protein